MFREHFNRVLFGIALCFAPCADARAQLPDVHRLSPLSMTARLPDTLRAESAARSGEATLLAFLEPVRGSLTGGLAQVRAVLYNGDSIVSENITLGSVGAHPVGGPLVLPQSGGFLVLWRQMIADSVVLHSASVDDRGTITRPDAEVAEPRIGNRGAADHQSVVAIEYGGRQRYLVQMPGLHPLIVDREGDIRSASPQLTDIDAAYWISANGRTVLLVDDHIVALPTPTDSVGEVIDSLSAGERRDRGAILIVGHPDSDELYVVHPKASRAPDGVLGLQRRRVGTSEAAEVWIDHRVPKSEVFGHDDYVRTTRRRGSANRYEVASHYEYLRPSGQTVLRIPSTRYDLISSIDSVISNDHGYEESELWGSIALPTVSVSRDDSVRAVAFESTKSSLLLHSRSTVGIRPAGPFSQPRLGRFGETLTWMWHRADTGRNYFGGALSVDDGMQTLTTFPAPGPLARGGVPTVPSGWSLRLDSLSSRSRIVHAPDLPLLEHRTTSEYFMVPSSPSHPAWREVGTSTELFIVTPAGWTSLVQEDAASETRPGPYFDPSRSCELRHVGVDSIAVASHEGLLKVISGSARRCATFPNGEFEENYRSSCFVASQGEIDAVPCSANNDRYTARLTRTGVQEYDRGEEGLLEVRHDRFRWHIVRRDRRGDTVARLRLESRFEHSGVAVDSDSGGLAYVSVAGDTVSVRFYSPGLEVIGTVVIREGADAPSEPSLVRFGDSLIVIWTEVLAGTRHVFTTVIPAMWKSSSVPDSVRPGRLDLTDVGGVRCASEPVDGEVREVMVVRRRNR